MRYSIFRLTIRNGNPPNRCSTVLVQSPISISRSAHCNTLLPLTRGISRREVRLRWTTDAHTLLREPTSVDGAIERLLGRVPADYTFEVRADGTELGHVAVVVFVDGHGLGCSLSQEIVLVKRKVTPLSLLTGEWENKPSSELRRSPFQDPQYPRYHSPKISCTAR